jgi:hypothetical protein
MAAAKGAGGQDDFTALPVQSMVCVSALPPSGDERGGHFDPTDLAGGWLFFAIGPQHRRVSITPGMHVDRDHPVVAAYPGHFSPSGEVVDTRVIRQVGEQARGAQALAAVSVRPIPATWQELGCARCGWRSGQGVMVPEVIDAVRWEQAKLNPYTDEHDPADVAESAYMRAWARAQAKARHALAEQARRVAGLHGQCSPEVEPLDLDDVLRDVAVVARRA